LEPKLNKLANYSTATTGQVGLPIGTGLFTPDQCPFKQPNNDIKSTEEQTNNCVTRIQNIIGGITHMLIKRATAKIHHI